ncbi:3-hydroxyacyl-ACP dehydratase FabZ [Candidatus Sumerlaeota bacterium]|nr:3-hydroxyacyl-ACP dehydratase FabZ [Candidatus Sumerlaeota bacterium]
MTEATPISTPLDVNWIKTILPHRFPFLMVDRVVEISHDPPRIVAIKNVTANEPHFLGHYPDYPVMPGVLIVEAMAQAAAIFMLIQPESKGRIPFFTGIDAVKFRRQVVPGDQLRIEVDITRLKRRGGKSNARCLVDGQLAAEAQLTCMLGDAQQEDQAAE